MRIMAVNTYAAPQPVGGATRIFESLVGHWQGSGHTCAVFSSDSELRGDYALQAVDLGGVARWRVTVPGVELVDWEPGGLEVEYLFRRVCDEFAPDVVAVHAVQRLGAGVVRAAQRAGVPVYVTMHDAWWVADYQFLQTPEGTSVLSDAGSLLPHLRPGGVSLLRSRARREYLRTCLDGCAGVATVSEPYRQVLQRIDPTLGLGVVENGVDVPQGAAAGPYGGGPYDGGPYGGGPRGGRPRLLHAGGEGLHKGLWLVLEALDRCTEPFELTVVDFSLPPGAEGPRQTHGDVVVRRQGPVAQDAFFGFLGGFDAVVAPSTGIESYGLLPREAVAAGCLLVALEGSPTVAGIPPGAVEPCTATPASLAAAMDRAARRARAGRAGADRAAGGRQPEWLRSAADAARDHLAWFAG